MNIFVLIGLIVFITFALWFYLKYKKLVNGMNSAPSNKLVILTDANFKKQISKGVVLVDFWADWCQPCKILGPVISEIAEEMSDKSVIAKLDVQLNQKAAQELGIRNIPTVIIFKDGQPVEKLIGVKPKKAYIKAIEQALM